LSRALHQTMHMKFIELLKKWNGGRLEAAQKRFGEKLGISSAAMSLYAAGKRIPTDDVKRKMAAELGLSLETLDRIFEETKKAQIYSLAERPAPIARESAAPYAPEESGAALLPVLGTVPDEFFRFSFDAVPSEYIDAPHPAHRETFALRVKGNHIAPKITDGEYLVVVKTGFVEDGQLALVRTERGCTVKRVYYRAGFLELRNDSKTGSVKLPEQDATIIGRVTGAFKKF